MTAPAPSVPPRPARRRLWFLLGAIGSALVVILVVLLIVWRGGAGLPGDTAAGGRPQPSRTPTPVALAAAPVPAATPAGPHPSKCGELYSPALVAAFGTAVLNPAWAEAAGPEVRHGTEDAELSKLIDTADKLTCIWGNPKGGSDSRLTTNLVWVTAEQSAAVKARLAAAGMTCYAELGGLRCVSETTGDAGALSGESHFLRDGIWLATHYVNSGPDGYTHDIIAHVWAGA
ncbi:hypothetical protein E3O19_11555 [Cryobacterium algoritolerans]|uniref:DUF3558 domain-containing protein n=1 Tax=Cryobacterium algoritolerans TaxID=1259184 RepID=A0A4R8WPQ7_9MICO|nr:hypothetical protein [Cryobacterium algoritolerans]TFC13969.1 hypothetical protein E3O19_11555 [Cryobacterium algoritolerans]